MIIFILVIPISRVNFHHISVNMVMHSQDFSFSCWGLLGRIYGDNLPEWIARGSTTPLQQQ